MIIKLDKGDTQQIFKDFVDPGTRNYINEKISQLFDKRVESIIKNKLQNINIEQMFQKKINHMVDQYFHPQWPGEVKHINELCEKKIEKFDFDKILTDKFNEKTLEKLWGRLVFRSKRV